MADSRASAGLTHGFRAKGLVFLGAREFYDERLKGGCTAVSDLLDPDVRAFFEQRFLTGGWYDVMPILAISMAAARAARVPHPRIVRENAEWMAKRDLRGIYRLIVAVASVELIVARLPDLSLRYFDFGHADGKMVGERLFESNRYGIPAPLADWFVYATAGFVPVALETAGAREVRVRAAPHVADGQAPPAGGEGKEAAKEGTKGDGIALVRTKFEISWE
jgi:hypothetical protein